MSISNNGRDPTFISKGHCNWKDATRRKAPSISICILIVRFSHAPIHILLASYSIQLAMTLRLNLRVFFIIFLGIYPQILRINMLCVLIVLCTITHTMDCSSPTHCQLSSWLAQPLQNYFLFPCKYSYNTRIKILKESN